MSLSALLATKLVCPLSAPGLVARRRLFARLDPDDNDPARFLRYLVAALRAMLPAVGADTLALLQGPQALPPASLLAPLINDLAVALSEAPATPLVLVLDDYHSIQSADVHALVTTLVLLVDCAIWVSLCWSCTCWMTLRLPLYPRQEVLNANPGDSYAAQPLAESCRGYGRDPWHLRHSHCSGAERQSAPVG